MQGVSNDSLYHVVMNYDVTYIGFCIILPKRWVLTLLPLCPGPLTPALIARIVLSMLHRCFLFEFECRCFASKSQEGMQHSRIQVLHTNSHCRQCTIKYTAIYMWAWVLYLMSSWFVSVSHFYCPLSCKCSPWLNEYLFHEYNQFDPTGTNIITALEYTQHVNTCHTVLGPPTRKQQLVCCLYMDGVWGC